MCLGGLISFDLNPMSIFSYPLDLALKAGFINPRYSVDDIIFKVRAMCDSNERIPVHLLPVPVISGPTIGTTLTEEFVEWARQLRRWMVGAAESFHYFVTHWSGRPLAAGLSWLVKFVLYYGVLLGAGAVAALVTAVLSFQSEYASPAKSWNVIGSSKHSMMERADALAALMPLITLGVQYLTMLTAFVFDYKIVRRLDLGAEERVGFITNMAQWLLSPLSMTLYAVLALAALVEFTVRGKEMAGHKMAAKEGFSTTTTPKELQRKETRSALSAPNDASLVDSLLESGSSPIKALDRSCVENALSAALPEHFGMGGFAVPAYEVAKAGTV